MFDLISHGLDLIRWAFIANWLVAHPATWIGAGSLLGVLAFLLDVGPLKRINAESFIGKVVLVTLCVTLLTGVGWLAGDAALGNARFLRDAPKSSQKGHSEAGKPPARGKVPGDSNGA